MEMDRMEKYIKGHKEDYKTALAEIKSGRKRSHWIWYIFPQIKGLGSSYFCKKYDIKSLDEAKEYLNTKLLRDHLVEICQALLLHKDKDIKDIVSFDDVKVLSCMTLFKKADENDICKGIFQKVIDIFYNGEDDKLTLEILEKQEKEKNEISIEEEKDKIEDKENNNNNNKNSKTTDNNNKELNDKNEEKHNKMDVDAKSTNNNKIEEDNTDKNANSNSNEDNTKMDIEEESSIGNKKNIVGNINKLESTHNYSNKIYIKKNPQNGPQKINNLNDNKNDSNKNTTSQKNENKNATQNSGVRKEIKKPDNHKIIFTNQTKEKNIIESNSKPNSHLNNKQNKKEENKVENKKNKDRTNTNKTNKIQYKDQDIRKYLNKK